MWLPKVESSASCSTIESNPSDVLVHIISFLPLKALLNLVSASRLLRTKILGDDYLARVWMYSNAPWWIPVPTQTPKKNEKKPKKKKGKSKKNPGKPSASGPRPYPASEWGTHILLTTGFPAGLDWAYIWRCMRSGSMQNRKRIWGLALDIEHLADQVGV